MNALNPAESIWACLDGLPTALQVFCLSWLQFCCSHQGWWLVVVQ